MNIQKLKKQVRDYKSAAWLFDPAWLLVVFSSAVIVSLVILRNEIEILHFFQRDLFKVFNPEDSPLLLVVAILWLVAAVVDLWDRAKNRYKTTDVELLLAVLIVVTYSCFRQSKHYIFLPEYLCIKYLDIPILYTVLRTLIGFVNRWVPNHANTDERLYRHGGPVVKRDDDELDFSPDAEVTAKDILQLRPDRCWRYGIVGKWGSGKTSYVNLVMNYLESYTDQRAIHIWFNPRSSASIASIQTDFFRLLAHKLKPYCSTVSWLIPRYMQSLSLANTYTWLTAIASLWRDNNTDTYKKELSRLISFLPGKLIVIIDDFDRLSAEEIVEVLKLMGTNACFNNMVYVVEYDAERVERVLSGYGENYIQKYIDINKNVPYRLSEKYYDEFKIQFDVCIKEIYDSSSRNSLIPRGLSLRDAKMLISKRLRSMRDVHVLLNTFCADYRILAGEVDVEQLLLLSVIKAFHRDEYELLKNYESSRIVNDGNNGCLMYPLVGQTRSHSSQDILISLFQGAPTKDVHDICDIDSFPLYIGRDMRFSFKSMEDIFSKERDEFEGAIRSSVVRRKMDDYLEWKLKKENLPDTFDAFKRMAEKILILAYNSAELTASAKRIVTNGAQRIIFNRTGVDKVKLNDFMESILFVPGSVDAFCLCIKILKESPEALSPTRGKYRKYIATEILALCDIITDPVTGQQERMVVSFLRLCTLVQLKNPIIKDAFLRLKESIYMLPSLLTSVMSVEPNLDGVKLISIDEGWQNLLLNDPDCATIIRQNSLVVDPSYERLYLNLANLTDYLVVTRNTPTKFPCLADNDLLKRIAEEQEKYQFL